ncbi:MAG: KilA-N domain-containing protein [Bacteroidota bacterium]
MKEQLEVQGLVIAYKKVNDQDYLSLTDIAKRSSTEPRFIILSWLKNASTMEFLEAWEEMHNPNFERDQMVTFKLKYQQNRNVATPQTFIQETGAIGLQTKSGKGGGTWAHKDIAINFCYWLSPTFQVYLIQEFQALKEQQASLEGKRWDLRRELAASNYFIHTDAVRENIVPMLEWNTKREGLYQASEADLLNLAVFGTTAKQWKALNPDAKGNLRDSATVNELRVLANMESINATLIEQGFTKDERLAILTRRVERELPILETKALQEGKRLK